MTVFDVRCDLCGVALAGPARRDQPDGPYGVRFSYHPGDPACRDDSGLLCTACWSETRAWLGAERLPGRCSRDGGPVTPSRSLHVQRGGELLGWQLCKVHAVEFLNRLRTVEPKFDEATLTLAGDWPDQSASST